MSKQPEKKQGKKLQGIVNSVSGEKTIRVRVETKFAHPLYKKIVKDHKNYLVHSDVEDIKIGDKVMIQEGKPISKKKKFYLINKI